MLGRTSRKVEALLIGAVFVGMSGVPAAAAPGDLDASFGDAGLVDSDFAGVAYGMTLQSDGKIVTAGGWGWGYYSDSSFALARFNTDGQPDASFGEGGALLTTFDHGPAAAYAVAIQADGKIVAAGTTGTSSVHSPLHSAQVGDRFALARYETDGTLDASFGSGGVVSTGFGSGDGGAAAFGVAIQADGKIVAAGFARKGFAIVRYDADGSLDASFGADGRVRTRVAGSRWNIFFEIAVQGDGAMVAAGTTSRDSGSGVMVARYLSDGSADPSFGAHGAVNEKTRSGDELRATVDVQPDGKYVVAAGRLIFRFNADGSLDPTFSDDGSVLLRYQLGALAAALQTDGSIVVSVRSRDFESFDVRRFDSTGALDRTFGGDGSVHTGAGYDSAAYAVAIQDDGKIVVAGTNDDTDIEGTAALARYLAA